MPSHDFEFDLRVDAAGRPGMLADSLAVEVARHLGYADTVASKVIAEVNVAVAEICRIGEACRVQFRAAGGELEVVVSSGTHSTRRFVHPIP